MSILFTTVTQLDNTDLCMHVSNIQYRLQVYTMRPVGYLLTASNQRMPRLVVESL